MVTISTIEMGNKVAVDALDKLEDVLKFHQQEHLAHAQCSGRDAYALHLVSALRGVLERNRLRLEQIDTAEVEAFKKAPPEELPF